MLTGKTKNCTKNNCKGIMKKTVWIQEREPDDRMDIDHYHRITGWVCPKCYNIDLISDKGTSIPHVEE